MGSGKYNKRVKIYARTVAQNSSKEDVEAWTLSGTRWANVVRGSGSERRVGAAQEQANLPVTVSIRYTAFSSLIKPQDNRLDFDGLLWDIVSAAEGKRRKREIVLIARARVK